MQNAKVNINFNFSIYLEKVFFLNIFLRLLDPCKHDSVCGINSKCTAVDHNVVCTCNNGFQPNPVAEESCVRSNNICHNNAQCGLGQECVGNICKVVCLSGMDCADGERCSNNKCEKVCFTASNCLTGEVCVEGICRPGCILDSDCDVSQICIGNKCRYKFFFFYIYNIIKFFFLVNYMHFNL